MKFTKIYPGAIGIMAILTAIVALFAGVYGDEATASAFKFAVAAAMPTAAMALIFARRGASAGGPPSIPGNAFALVIMSVVPISVLLGNVGITPLLELLADDAVGPTAMFEGFGMGLIGSIVAVGMAYATADRDD